MFVDTHCHLDLPLLAERLPATLARAEVAGVTRFIIPGITPKRWLRIMALAARDNRIFAAPGVHPLAAADVSVEVLEQLEQLALHAVAIGEIGLDYCYPQIPRELQRTAFRAQLNLAVRLEVPVIIHCRRAFADLLAILREVHVGHLRGVMHAFSGSPEIAAECVRHGLYIGVAGAVTFVNAIRPVEVVRHIPLDKLLLESDAPDLTPTPHRGTPNEPAFLLETAKIIAAVKGITLEQVAAETTSGAERLFLLR